MFKIVIVGRPNVGKSMLFNTLIGERKAIVERTPGVTRDMIEGYMELENNKGVLLIDTGGINWGGKDFFNKAVIEVVEKSLAEADLVLLVVDAKEGLTTEDLTTAEYLRKTGKKVILVVNKVEGKEDKERALDFYSLGFEEIVFLSAKIPKNITQLKEIIKKYAQNHLEKIPEIETIKIAIIGRPNVGKSTLLNKLLGYERMIVSEIPGTTRDCIDVFLTLPNGSKYLLIDTPGIRRRTKIDKRAEKFSVDKALDTIKKIDIVLFMITAEEGVTNQDQRLLRQVQKNYKACILLVNKWDLFDNKREAGNLMLEKIKYGIRFIPWAPLLTISAKTGRRVNQIFPLIEEVYKQYSARVKTALVNKILEELKRNYTFNIKGKRVKFYYATQIDIKPPTFVIFTNINSEDISQHIKKFIKNSFQKYLGFDKVPIRIMFRLRD
ncbi:MAG: Double Era-like domain GTPase Der [Thermodesulfobacteria bacterium]|nr:ribosome biogenesis GTPase Der [Thermodesulfobacteriota bacterium]MCU4137508.1 Double Era-like domain GTPase Der [Thermodesulfobacteriota bacterium]